MQFQYLFSALLFCITLNLSAQEAAPSPFETPFEKDENYSATYQETIDFYKKLAAAHPELSISAQGSTDSGQPLHAVVLSKDRHFSPRQAHQANKVVLFINNAIHPGEPCGVDASMMLLRDLLEQTEKQALLEHVVIVLIPFYNIGGGLNRSGYSRANQNGPVAHGFRGNAKNLDLNRDFIKADSKNAQSFNKLFAAWNPHIFMDNHTSNGADYQYTMTLISTQKDKLQPELTAYLAKLEPQLFQNMKKAGWEMTPYVYARNTPDEGIYAFLDLPRYSSGYAALHQCIGFMPETHMFKPFADRVRSTYSIMESMLQIISKDHQEILTAKKTASQAVKQRTNFDLNWELDTTVQKQQLFKGYTAKYKPSEVTGLDRLYYDRNAPYEKNIPFFTDYNSNLSISKPQAYIIPQAYEKVIQRLRWNQVKLQRLTQDIELEVEMYRIEDLKTRTGPYEGHFLHSNVKVNKETRTWQFFKGDYVVYADQATNAYIMAALEPQAPDSYFAWNFFDGILNQKEYFSSYVFEDLAAQLLAEDPALRARLEAKKAADEAFAQSARAQLTFIYKNSPYYEPTHRLYPIARLMSLQKLPVY